MKKNFVCIIFGIFLALSVNVAADTYYQFVASQNTLYVDGVKVEMPMYNYQYTNYASIRGVAEALGLDVNVAGTRIDFTSKSPVTVKTTEEIAENIKSTAFIRTYDTAIMEKAKVVSTGSGVVLDNGIIVTNFHVIGDGYRYGIVYNDTEEGQEYRTSSWINIDISRDIGIINSPDTNAEPAKLGNSDNLKLGEKVVAIGSPLGLKNTVSEGIISGFRKINGQNFIQITTPISPGSSGGGLFNARGELIGITTLKIVNGESLNFAIPINEVKNIINSKSVQLQMALSAIMRVYTYDDNNYFFNFVSSAGNDGYYEVSYFLFEEYEGSKAFLQSFKDNKDFQDNLMLKIEEVTKKLEEYGYKKYNISIYAEDKYVKWKYENEKVEQVFNNIE